MSSVMFLEFTAFGFPAPKGSMRAAKNMVIPSGGKANAAAQADWGGAVRRAAVAAMVAAMGPNHPIPFMGVPIRFRAVWRMQRPGGHFVKKGPKAGEVSDKAPRFPLVAPDTSKLLRSTEDWLNKLVWDDDSRVVETHMRKIYAVPGQEGALIRIENMLGVP